MRHEYSTSARTRFWSKVDQSGCCWPWTAGKTSHGYGVFHIGPKTLSAHRVAFELAHGPIPEGQLVRHTCDMRACVNPDHLIVGTHGDNVDDKVARQRQARGEHNGKAKLQPNDVRSIRTRHGLGESINRLASEFGVSRKNIRLIVRRETWTHI